MSNKIKVTIKCISGDYEEIREREPNETFDGLKCPNCEKEMVECSSDSLTGFRDKESEELAVLLSLTIGKYLRKFNRDLSPQEMLALGGCVIGVGIATIVKLYACREVLAHDTINLTKKQRDDLKITVTSIVTELTKSVLETVTKDETLISVIHSSRDMLD